MVDWWTEISLAMASFLDRHGLLAAFVVLLIEEAGVPVPVPGDVLMLILGVRARQGTVQLWEAIVVVELGTIIGSTVLYFAARLAGRGHFGAADIDRQDRSRRHSPRNANFVTKTFVGHGRLVD